MRPFPNVAAHIGAAIRRIALRGINANGGCSALAAFIGIAVIFIEGIVPHGLFQSIRSTCGFFPLGFGGQANF